MSVKHGRVMKTGIRTAELDAVIRSWYCEMTRRFKPQANIPNAAAVVKMCHDRLRQMLGKILVEDE